jgi:hypothetical protein
MANISTKERDVNRPMAPGGIELKDIEEEDAVPPGADAGAHGLTPAVNLGVTADVLTTLPLEAEARRHRPPGAPDRR